MRFPQKYFRLFKELSVILSQPSTDLVKLIKPNNLAQLDAWIQQEETSLIVGTSLSRDVQLFQG